MQLPFEHILRALYGEVFSRRNVVIVLFTIISLSILAMGTIWPKRYTSTAIIIADDSNILQPLMEGTAEATRVTNYAGNAREILFGEVIMSQILEDAGWLKPDLSDIQKEQIRVDLKKQIKISGIGRNLIKIRITDSDAMRAYITAKRMAELFIEEGEKSKINESQAAFNFIEKQVNEYLQKLTKVEKQLEEIRSNNPDARPGTENEVTVRIRRLSAEIERTQLELRETLIKSDSLQGQLSGEAAITISMSKEGQYRSKISILQTRLETLRLDYRETYPDIVRLKHQIADLKESMNAEIEQRKSAKIRAHNKGDEYVDEAILLNPLYHELRSDSSTTQTKIATLQARISEMNKMLNKEYDRAKRIHSGEAALSKLTRNYQVNQDIYKDLLRRMERARVSKNLDEENQGLTFKLQEPAKIPLIPTGLRFIHFAAMGMIFGFAIPIGFIYLMLQLDTRIRFSQIISEELNIPVLVEIYQFSTVSENRKIKTNLIILSSVFSIVFVIYGYVGWLKVTGQM
jgi:protein tyrosine kinase modulator